MYSPAKTVAKAMKEGVSVSVAAVLVVQGILENVMGVETTKEQVVEVAGALGVVAGVVRGFFNWLKNRKK